MSYTNKDFNPSKSTVVDDIKSKTDEIISYLEDNLPSGRRKSLAITNYEQAAMWAVKSYFD